MVALPRDRYVIRSYSPMVTIGGGELLDVAPAKSRRSPALAARLRTLETSAPAAVLEAHVQRVGGGGARVAELRARTSFGPAALRELLDDLVSRGRVLLVDREWYVHVETAERVRQEAATALAAFHDREPLKAGMSKEELRTRLGGLEERVFLALLERFAGAGVLVVDKDKVRQAGHAVRLSPAQQAASDRIEAEFRAAGVAPPTLDEAFAKLGLSGPSTQAIAQLLVEGRRLDPHPRGPLFPRGATPGRRRAGPRFPPPAPGDHAPGDQGSPGDLAEVCDSAAGVAGQPATHRPGGRQACPPGGGDARGVIGPVTRSGRSLD